MKTVTKKTAFKKSHSTEKKDTFIERILENLDQVNAKDWEVYTNLKSIYPTNLFTGTPYKGFNVMALYLDAVIKGLKTARYATFNSISKAGGRLKKGAKGCVIEFFSFIYKDKLTKKIIPLEVVKTFTLEQLQNIDKIAVVKNYVVFNSELIENIEEMNLDFKDEDFEELEILSNENCDNFIKKIIVNGNLSLRFGQEQTAFYSPKLDYAMLPNREFFISNSKYYATLLHEIIHWTGHETRLNRNLKGHSDKQSYSFEELIAEMGAMLCSLQFGIFDEFTNSVRYLKGWASANSQDRETLIRKAFTESKKAKKYLENL